MSRREKFSEKSIQAFSSRNRTWKGVESEVDALEQKGFWDGVDLLFGAIEQTNRKKGRETSRKVPTQDQN